MSAPKPGLDALLALNQEIAALVRAGIPLEVGLRDAAGAGPLNYAMLADRIAERLSAGDSLTEALRKEGPAVTPEYLAVIEAGLVGGRLPEALENLAGLGLTMQDVRRRVWLAATYPLIVCSLAYLMFVLFIVFGVPVWVQTRTALMLPPNRFFDLLSTLRDTARWWGPAIPIVVVLSLAGLPYLFSRRVSGASRPIAGLLWIPGVRQAYFHLLRAQFSRLLAVLIDHQIPAARAVALASESAGDPRLQLSGLQISADLERGASWSDAVNSAQDLPRFLRWMMVTGEKQGTLAAVLRQAGDAYQRKADRWLEWLRGTLPVVLVSVLCGGVVLIYGIGLFMPLQQFWYDLMQANP